MYYIILNIFNKKIILGKLQSFQNCMSPKAYSNSNLTAVSFFPTTTKTTGPPRRTETRPAAQSNRHRDLERIPDHVGTSARAAASRLILHD